MNSKVKTEGPTSMSGITNNCHFGYMWLSLFDKYYNLLSKYLLWGEMRTWYKH